MFFLIGKKKWLELIEQVQAAQEATEDCRTQLNAMQNQWRAAQSEFIKAVADSAESITQGVRRELDVVKAALERQGEFLSAQAVDTQGKLLQGLDDSRDALTRIQQKLDAAEASSAALRDSIQASGERSTAVLEHHSGLLSKQAADAQGKLLRELEDSREALARIQRKLDAAEASSAALQENIQANDARSVAALEHHSGLLSKQAADAQGKLLRELEDSRDALTRIQQKLDAAGASSASIQESIQAGSARASTEITRIRQELSSQLMLLDESSRLLLLHMVMNELDIKQK